MTAFLRENDRRGVWLLPRYGRYTLAGVSLPEAVLPKNCSQKGLARAAARLRREGIRRFLPVGDWEGRARFRAFLPEVTPLPLYRALADRLLLNCVEHYPPRERRVALRGIQVDGCVRVAAEALCPRVGTLILDFERGGEELAEYLHRRYGAAPLTECRGEPPHAAAEFSPRQDSFPRSLKLWGRAELPGWRVAWTEPLPAEVPSAEWLTVLWEMGRISPEEISFYRSDAIPPFGGKRGNTLTEA